MTQKPSSVFYTQMTALFSTRLWKPVKVWNNREIKITLKLLRCRTKSVSPLNLSKKKKEKKHQQSKRQPFRIAASHLRIFFFYFFKPCSSLPPPALMVIGLISDEKWCGICWEQLCLLLNLTEGKSLRSLLPAILPSLICLSASQYGMMVCQEKNKIKTQLYCLSNISFVSH